MQTKSTVLIFIETERAKGVGEQKIQHKLLDAGWHMDIINKAMAHQEPITIKSDLSNVKKASLKSKLHKKASGLLRYSS